MTAKYWKLTYLLPIFIACGLYKSVPAIANQNSSQPQVQSKQDDDKPTKDNEENRLQGIPADVNAVAEKITVRIDGSNGNGSGVIFAQQKFEGKVKTYYVLTAKHVVEQNQEYKIVTPDRESYAVTPSQITQLNSADLAVLTFQSEAEYNLARFGDYQFVANEEVWVFTYGWAKNGEQAQAQFSAGKIAGKETGIFLVKDNLSLSEGKGYELVYTNLSQKGMSGGAVLDTNGRVIGIHASAEGERYRLVDKLQLGFSLGVPVGKFLQSDYAKQLTSEQVAIATTKERLDIDPFAQPKLSQADLESIQNNLTQVSYPIGSTDETEWLNYGNKLWRLSRYEEAIKAYERAIENNADFYQAYYGKGLATYNQGNYQAAATEFEQATKIQTDFYPAWYRKSLSLLNSQQYQKALEAIDRAIALKPENVALYALKGEALQNLNQLTKAVAAYSQAISEQDNSILLVRRGSLYRTLEQHQLALEDFNQAAHFNPKYIETYINRGLAYYQLGNYAQAKADFNHAIALDRQDPRGYLARGFVNHQLSQPSQSTIDFYRAWQLNQQFKNNNSKVDNLNTQPNKYAQIPLDFNYTLQAKASDGHYYLGKSVVLDMMGDKQQAIASLNQAVKIFQTESDRITQQLSQKLLTQIQQTTAQTSQGNNQIGE